MAFKRYNGTVEPFAKDSTGANRTVFGNTLQSDDIDDNLNTHFKRGWEIVGINDNPTKQDFNGLAYTVSSLVAYLYQQGIAEYNPSQKYVVNSIVVASDGKLYRSLRGNGTTPNVGNNPITDRVNWKKLSEGDNTQRFKVADAVSDDEALSKGQLLTEIKAIDGEGKGLDADLLDGKHAIEFNRQIDTSSANAGPGWVTVAENIDGRFQGDIIVSDSDSVDQSYIKLHWMRSFSDSNVTVTTCGGYRNRITGVRVLYDTSDNVYGKKILQVYATVRSIYRVNIFKDGNVEYWGGHTAVTPVVQNTLAGYAVHRREITELDEYSLASVKGIVAEGNMKAPRFIGVADDASLLGGISSERFMQISTLKDPNGGGHHLFIPRPGGGEYSEHVSDNVSAIQIALPVLWTGTMVMFYVDIYDYSSQTTMTFQMGGYLNSDTSSWKGVNGTQIGGTVKYNVRFGSNGTKACIQIGELNDTGLDDIKVTVRDFTAGYSGATKENWEDGWEITRTQTALTQLDYTINSNVWSNLNDGAGSGLDADNVRGLPADFTSSKNTNGYQKLPSGLIIQWGLSNSFTLADHDAVQQSIVFPISFPNACFFTNVSIYIDGPGSTADVSASTNLNSVSTTGFVIDYDNLAVTDKTIRGTWIAIGY